MSKKKWGGRRPGAGRLPLSENEETERTTVTMPESAWDVVREVGDGNASAGIRLLVDGGGLANYEHSPIRLTDPLPCGIRSAEGNCGKPATVAYAYRWQHPLYLGHFVLLPVCRECALAAMAVYE